MVTCESCVRLHSFVGIPKKRVYIWATLRGPMDKNSALVMMGIADPGTGDRNSMFWTCDELQRLVKSKSLINTPVLLEHGDATAEVVGRVAYAWVDMPTGLHVIMEFDKSLIRTRALIEWVKSGIFTGLSLGYAAYMNKSFDVEQKKIHEVSIVRTPYHPTCLIYHVGSIPPSITENM